MKPRWITVWDGALLLVVLFDGNTFKFRQCCGAAYIFFRVATFCFLGPKLALREA
ncbi:MAG: hypothetical protein ACJAVR_001491 [Paracoccaceae bacterium]|jgi:hypothetical protein